MAGLVSMVLEDHNIYQRSGQLSWAGGINICGGPSRQDSTTLDVATKSIVYAIPSKYPLLP